MNILASPFWVNFLLFSPIILWFYWRKHKLDIDIQKFLFTTVFGIAFGFIESACVIYLRAVSGFLPGFQGTLLDVQKQSRSFFYFHQITAEKLPLSLSLVEMIREGGTILMLLMFAYVATKYAKERFAIFILAFAFWDLFYYVFLYLTIHWPQSFVTQDILFLIPQPWIAGVWLPILIDILIIIAVFFNRFKKPKVQ